MASKWLTVMMAWSRKPQRTSAVEHDDHGEAGIQGADDEVGREDGLLPARHQARGEIEPDDRVHRDHKRHGERGQRRVERLVAVPVPGRAAPAEREDAVEQARRETWRGRAWSARSGIRPT